MSKKILAIIFVLLLAIGISAKDLMLADIPIWYGKERFAERIEDRVAGARKPIGLVLSGGSARAFAHIGVLRYLEEMGIVPDFIVSNSMGSIVGLLYAAGLSPDQILEITSSTSLETLFDLTLPLKGGLLDSSRFLERISSILGRDLRLEDLEIPIIVTAEDIVTKRQIYICEGDFYTVMVASFALPVYFPPVSYHDHRLIDGGITNLVPVGIAGEFTDSIILSTTFYENEELDLNNPVTILNVSIDISKRRRGIEEMKALSDSFIWIRNDVESISFMEFAKVLYLQEKGYEAAKAQSEALGRLKRGYSVSSFAKKREKLDEAIQIAEREYATFEHLCRFDDSQMLGIGIWSSHGSGVRPYLIDDMTLGVSYTASKRDLSVEINGGFAFNWVRSGHMRSVPAMKTRLYCYFLNHWRAAVGGGVFYDARGKGFLFSYNGLLEGRYPIGEIVDFGISQTFEGLYNYQNSKYVDAFPESTYLAASTVTIELPKLRWLEKGLVDVAYQAYGDYRHVRSFLNAHGSMKIRDPFAGIYLEGQSSARFALDDKGDVPLFISDRFRTNHDSLVSQGHDLTVSSNSSKYLAVVNLGLGYQPVSYRPTFAEMFLFEDSRVGVFADLLFNGDFFFSVGLEVETTISLLGITELGVLLYGGLDWASKYPIWGVYFTVTH
jgi:NTE family protein